jgi:hypothetical protein
MKKVAIMVRQPQRQHEALRSSLGCLLENLEVTYLVLDHEVPAEAPFTDNLSFLDDMEGRRFSNHPANAAQHGFTYMTLEDMGEFLRQQDIIIPF